MKKLFFLLSLSYSSFCTAQINLEENVRLVTKTNDTLAGTVRWESELEMSALVSFTANGGHKQEFNPEDLKSLLLLNDSLFFEPVTIFKNQKGAKISVTRLAKVVCKGYMSLYRLQLPQELISKDCYPYAFVVRKDNEDNLLTHAESHSTPGYNKYIGVLRYLTRDSKISDETIKHTAYTQNSISMVVNKYNQMQGQSETVQYNTKNKAFFSNQIRVGGAYIPKYNFAPDFSLTGGTGWSIGYAFDVMNPATSKRFYTSLELDYLMVKFPEKSVKNNYTGVTEKADLTIKGIFFRALAVYKLTQTRVSPLILGGLAIEYSNITHFFPHLAIGAGVKGGKFMACARYERPLGVSETGWPATGLFNFKIGYAFLESKSDNK